MRDQSIGYKQRGWDVHLVVTNDRGDYFGEMMKEGRCHDLSHIPLSLKKVRAAAELINSINPTVLLCNHAALIHYALPLLNKSIRPVVVVHSPELAFIQVARLMAHRVWKWVVPSPGLADIFKAVLPGSCKGKVSVLAHGVNETIFYAGLNRPAEPIFQMVFCGSFLPHKGVDLLPLILEGVVRQIPHAKLTIIGDGGSRPAVATEFQKRRLGEAVEWCGRISQQEVANYFRHAHIFLFPTRMESFGLVIAEAMACGAVPVVTRLDGITDQIVEDGKSGMLVAVDDVEGYTNAIIGLAKDSNRLASFSRNAVLSAKERFSLTRMLDDYERLFDEADTRSPKITASTLGWLLEVAREVAKRKLASDLLL